MNVIRMMIIKFLVDLAPFLPLSTGRNAPTPLKIFLDLTQQDMACTFIGGIGMLFLVTIHFFEDKKIAKKDLVLKELIFLL